MHSWIANLVASYGYLVLFILVGMESLGIPLPGETALVTAAAFAATGRLNLYIVIAVAAAAAIIGDNGGYWIGRKGGLALVTRYGRHVGLTEAKLTRARKFFDRHGAKAVFLGRFIALLRSWAAALAGIGHMPYGVFTFWNALGGVVWASLFGTLGYLFGENLPRLEHYIGRISLVLGLVVLVGLVVGARMYRARRRKA
jgi:membrane protein DedA with SNARE-associated domain